MLRTNQPFAFGFFQNAPLLSQPFIALERRLCERACRRADARRVRGDRSVAVCSDARATRYAGSVLAAKAAVTLANRASAKTSVTHAFSAFATPAGRLVLKHQAMIAMSTSIASQN